MADRNFEKVAVFFGDTALRARDVESCCRLIFSTGNKAREQLRDAGDDAQLTEFWEDMLKAKSKLRAEANSLDGAYKVLEKAIKEFQKAGAKAKKATSS